jgi:hypothetical protein
MYVTCLAVPVPPVAVPVAVPPVAVPVAVPVAAARTMHVWLFQCHGTWMPREDEACALCTRLRKHMVMT